MKGLTLSKNFMKKRLSILSIAVLVLLVFAGISYGSLLDVIPESSMVVIESSNIANVVDIIYSDQFSTITGGSVDITKQREEVKEVLGFDALDPEFLKKLFENGVIISLTGFSESIIPEILIVFSPKNKMSFLKFVKAVEEKTGIKEEVSTYKGINIIRLPIPELPNNEGIKEIAWSMIGKNIVFGSSVVSIKEAIEVFKGEKVSISKNANYSSLKDKVLKKLGSSPFFAYIATDKFVSLFEKLKLKLPEEEREALDSAIVNFKTLKPTAFGGTSDADGTKLYFVSKLPDNYKKIYENITFPEFKSLGLFPKNTFLFLGGVMPLSWEQIKDMLPSNTKKTIEDGFKKFASQTGIDIEEMFLSWLSKEIAIGIFDPSGMLPKLGLVLGYSDKNKAQNTLNMIVNMIGPSLGAQPQDRTYEGINYKLVDNPMFPLGFGFVSDRLVIASGVENMIDVVKGNMVGLGKNEVISRIASQPNVSSIIYIDVSASLSIIERLAGMGGGLDEETEKALKIIKKIENIVFWGGYEKGGYSFGWLEIENAK